MDNTILSAKKKTNVTFSVSAELLNDARKKASKLDLSLNDVFLEWLEQFARGRIKKEKLKKLFKQLSHVNAGRKFSREEAYEE